jgi:outer membrane protein assembly factor BamB
MSTAVRLRALAVCIILQLLGSHSLGRDVILPPAAKDPEPAIATPEPVVLATEPLARRKIDAAHDYIKAGSWAEAVRLLQALLDARGDAFLPLRPADSRAKGVTRWGSIHAEAERLLAGLPPAGKEFYRLNYEGLARRLLADARSRADRAALHEVSRRFGYTRAGAEALALLGSHYLDRGQPALAAACFRLLTDGRDSEPLAPQTYYHAALAFRACGDAEREAAAWNHLSRRLGSENLDIGGRRLSLDGLRIQAAQFWPERSGGAALVGAYSKEDLLLFRGDSRRAAMAEGAAFLLQPLWQMPTATGETAEWIQRARRNVPAGVLPAGVPLVIEERIVFRSTTGVEAVDADSGRTLWRAPDPLGLEAILADPGRKVQVRNWFDLYGRDRGLLLANSTLGTLSSDGRRVFAVEDLPLPPHPSLQQQGEPRSLGPLRHAAGHNRLRALDLATGAMVWEVGGPAPVPPAPRPLPPRGVTTSSPPRAARLPKAPTKDDPLAGAFFLGPPLPLGDELLVLLDKQEDVRLVCLGAERGEVRWTQSLVAAGEKMLLDVDRRTHAAHLAYSDGVLVCPTNCGAVVGVDPLSRRLLWAHIYREQPTTQPGTEEQPAVSRPLQTAWTGCAPIIAGGRVIVSAPDSDNVCCLGLADGRLWWKVPRTEEELFVGGVFADQVLLVGRDACRSLSLSNGELLWRRITGLPAGQGVIANGVYYLPLAAGAIAALDLRDPRASTRIEPQASGLSLGNLVSCRGSLWSQGAGSLICFTRLRKHMNDLEARLAQAPHDAAALAERGRLRLEKGELTGGIADLREAVRNPLSAHERAIAQARLFRALTDILRDDFPLGEKFLEDYETLCVEAPAGGKLPSPEVVCQRRAQLSFLVARGRERQGRAQDALAAWRELLANSRAGELLPPPDEPGLQVRPELLARERIANLARAAGGPGRALGSEMQREWQGIQSASAAQGLAQFVKLYGSMPSLPGTTISGPKARLGLAQQWAESPDPRDSLRADLALRALAESPKSHERETAAQALACDARLLTRRGMLEEAAAAYHRLGKEFPEAWAAGRTGTGALAEARLDKRLLPAFERLKDAENIAWPSGRIKVVERPGGPAWDNMIIPCVPRQPFSPAVPGTLGVPPTRPCCDGWRFFVDGHTNRLIVTEKDSGKRLWSVPLPLQAFLPYLRNGELPSQLIDHLLLVAVGPRLLAIDLLDRRVCWVRDALEDLGQFVPGAPLPDGAFQVFSENAQTIRRLGWVGPAMRDGVLFLNASGLSCLDPATGATRWIVAESAPLITAFSDGEHVFISEHHLNGAIGGLRAVRLADGTAVRIPIGAAAYARRLRVLGQRLLVCDDGPAGEMILRLYNILTGKDDWKQAFPSGSVVLSSPAPELLGVISPEGVVAVVDLATRRDGPRLHIDARHRANVTAGCLLADAGQFYVGLQGHGEGSLSAMDGPNPYFRGLISAPVNGMLYAFDRATGDLRWYSQAPSQAILLERFDELPVILCAAVSTRQIVPGFAEGVLLVRSLDKKTGKLLFNRELHTFAEPFGALRIDRREGTIDLINSMLTLRHKSIPVGSSVRK